MIFLSIYTPMVMQMNTVWKNKSGIDLEKMRARPGGLALGCVRGRGLDISLVAGAYGSPR